MDIIYIALAAGGLGCLGVAGLHVFYVALRSRSRSRGDETTRVWLDDVRDPPDSSWIVVRNYDAFVRLMTRLERCDEVSFDHDLGETMTGHDAVTWIENRAATDPTWTPPTIMRVHSANPVGRQRIVAAIASVKRIVAARG